MTDAEPIWLVPAKGSAAMLAGGAAGGLLIAAPLCVAELTTGDVRQALGLGLITFLFVSTACLIAVLFVLPFWVLMHVNGLTKRRHAMALGVIAPSLFTIFGGLGTLVSFAVVGAVVALTIQRVYYGKAPS